jgi:hypothetical protein
VNKYAFSCYPITFIWLLNLDIETKVYKKTKDSRSKIQEMYSKIQQLLDHRRNEDVLEELKVDPVKKKLAQYKQKRLNHISRMENTGYPKRLTDY